jgi:hypothetical protein
MRGDDHPIAPEQAIPDPEHQPRRESHKHLQRRIGGRSALPRFTNLWNIGKRREDRGANANPRNDVHASSPYENGIENCAASPPPLAPRSCVRRTSSVPRNSPATVALDPHDQQHSQGPRHRPQSGLHCSRLEGPTQPPEMLKNESSQAS